MTSKKKTMEMRSLIRGLRARPTSLYTPQPSSILRGQFLAGQRSLRFSSSDNAPRNSPAGSQTNQSSPSPSNSQSHASDFDQILDKLNLDSAHKSRATPSPFASSSPSTAPGQSSANQGMSVARAATAATVPGYVDRPLRKVSMKLGPSLGRQVAVEPERGNDLAQSLRVLNMVCNQNKVRQDSNNQKFHVRRGQLRKTMRVVRWRRLFKYSFNHTVSRINRMRAQGW